MASITKIGDGKYFVRASKGTGKNRRFINETVRGTLKDAKKVARQKETLLDLGYTPDEITLTFEKYFEKWLKAIKSKVAPRTFEDYKENIERYALDVLRPLKLADIKPLHIQNIYDKMLERGLGPTTVRNLHAPLNACFTHAVKKEYTRKNPCKNSDLPQKSVKPKEVLSIDEAPVFVEHCEKSKNGIIFEFGLETGMRPEEYLALRWRDIDFQHNTASVNQVVVFARSGGGYTFEKCKTKKSRRLIPLSSDLRNRLMDHRRAQNEWRMQLKVSYLAHDLVFANEIGGPYAINNITRRYFKPILDKCAFGKHLTLYSLRHSCATILLIQGENPKVVADRLGHSSVVITLDTYSHVLPHIQEAATAKMDNVLRLARK
jgi:integrase